MTVAEIFETMEYGPAPEAAGPALAWLDRHERKFGHFVDGAFVAGSGHFDSVNPANGRSLAHIAQATPAEIDAAVAAARTALPAWRALPGHDRARFLYALARQVQKHSRLLAVLETLDNGKPIRETRDIDMPLVARHFYHHAGWAQLVEREFPGHAPVGVVGQIIPWNFPLLMLAWKVAPALAAGNTVVLKPAEFTSLTALAFAELCQAAGLPPGVVNVVTGDGAARRVPRRAPRRRQDRLHGLDRGGPPHPPQDRRHAASGCRSSWAGRARSSCSTTPTSTAWSRAWSTRSGSTRGRCAAPARACWCRSRSPSACSRSCARAWSGCASATRSTRRWTSARSSRPCSSRASSAW